MTDFWDGNSKLPFVKDDGGRSDAGFKGSAGDCVARSVAIASGIDYKTVYGALAEGNASQRGKKKGQRSARNGIQTSRKWFKDYMRSLGFEWVPLMKIGSGCTCNLVADALPMGRLVVSLSKHYTAVIDGVIHDTSDPQRCSVVADSQGTRLAHRCVYGYWKL